MKQEPKIEILQEGQRIPCKNCGCHYFGIIAKGHHCGMCGPVMGTKVAIKTMDNKQGQVIKEAGLDEYSVRLKDGSMVENLGQLEIEIIEK